jgi:16S rRNA (cytosine1402-N4)-methyltransferase
MSDFAATPDSGPPVPHRRRPRYAGKNPRRFGDKYKELDPDRYAADVAKVLASGKTPAGTHRPILVAEIMAALVPQPGEVVVDCTLGFGGHARELLARITPGGRLIGLDVDPLELPKTAARLRTAGCGEDVFTPVRSNFAGLPRVLAELGLAGADAILADLGVSSMQLDDPARGFSFKTDGPLDLRLNPHRPPSAADWLARVNAAGLAAALAENADEPHAALLARELTVRRARTPFTRTRPLADAIREILRADRPRAGPAAADDSVRRVFQALRIAVNDELGALETALPAALEMLRPGGRLAVISFHSLEDRIVKQFIAEKAKGCTCPPEFPICNCGKQPELRSLTRKPVRPSAREIDANPRSSSARLRVAVKI